MNQLKTLVLLAISALMLSACSTIHFKNGDVPRSEDFRAKRWHHIGVLRLVEFSPPVNPKYLCEDQDWNTVRTRTGALQVLVGAVTYGLYGPEEASVSCK